MENNRITIATLIIFFLISTISPGVGQDEGGTKIGPSNGHLVIVGGGGGGGMKDIIRKFVDLAGGSEAEIVVIPTAGGRDEYDDDSAGASIMREMAKKVTVIHTNEREIANSDEFVKPLSSATGVWFGGGRQWRLVDAYKDTRTEELFHEILERGGTIGGSSAGATIQGSYLARGDTKTNQIMMGDHEEGFGFIRNIAIDQHVLARNRHFDMFDILKNRPELLGISVDERTAIVVKGDQFEVIGDSYVIIYDNSFWSREGWEMKSLPPDNRQFYFLKEGDKYDLNLRQVIK